MVKSTCWSSMAGLRLGDAYHTRNSHLASTCAIYTAVKVMLILRQHLSLSEENTAQLFDYRSQRLTLSIIRAFLWRHQSIRAKCWRGWFHCSHCRISSNAAYPRFYHLRTTYPLSLASRWRMVGSGNSATCTGILKLQSKSSKIGLSPKTNNTAHWSSMLLPIGRVA